ncbi:MADS box transcription factor [Melia azedarach]|uniref:MADS box transcription factor n=1 Tax=Melia azedarach TaxID=155640 RepID=A0ACC1Z2J1_MELAZ|nr:MADS box transcription factor [Melia azedarach]
MGRKKLEMKKIEDSSALQVTYTKRRDGLLKKANELSVLCDTDVGLVMFSPSSKLTKFSSSGRIEDILLRYISQHSESQEPLENEEHLVQSLMHSKCEGELLDMIAKKEVLEKKLIQLIKQQLKAKEKLSFYQPKVENITSIYEAYSHEQHISGAIQRIEKLKDKMLGKDSAPGTPQSVEQQAAVSIRDTNFTTDESASSKRKRNHARDANHWAETSSPAGLNTSIQFLDQQKHWILESGGHVD